MTNQKRNRLIAWGLCVFAVVGITAVATTTLIDNQRQGILDETHLVEVVGFGIVLSAFVVLGTLIISHQPQNRIGWLLLIPVWARMIPVEALTASPPETVTIGWWLVLWYAGWAWMPLIFPILLLPVHFPTGRPPTPRWNWINWLALGMWALLAFVSAFPKNFADVGMIPNPIGFLPPELPEQVWNSAPWSLSLFLMAGGSVVSLFVRYGRAQTAERQQIKWLAYAGIFFVAVYGLVVSRGFAGQSYSVWVGVLFYLSVLTFAAAIAVAILRYRLFDIDLIIRKTVQYGVVTAVLALVYFGTIILLQSLMGQATGEQSPIVIVLSTLLIAAMFNPLRRRVQTAVDRRFYRQKYNAQQVLAQFAQTARDEVDMAALQAELLRVVQETMQPEQLSIWLRDQEGLKTPWQSK